jgi:hypothetical protein
MSLFKALQSYQSLTPDQKIFIREKRIEGRFTPQQWLFFFNRIAEYDSLRDASSGKFGWLGCVSILLLVASLVIGIITVFLLPLFFLALILFIAMSVFFVKRRKDVPNHLRQFIVPLLLILREEMEPEAPMFLRVDLSEATGKDKLFSEQLSPAGLRLQQAGSKITEKIYSNQWLTGAAELADGTKLQWQVFERIRERSEGKRRSSGKYKTKTKHKIKARVQVAMQFKRGDYALTPFRLHTATEKIEVKNTGGRDKIRVRRIAVRNKVNEPLPLSQLLEAIATAYKRAMPSQPGGQA